MRSYNEAAAIYEMLELAEPKSVMRMHDLGVAYNEVGCTELKLGDEAAAIAHFRQRQALLDNVAAAEPDDMQHQEELLISYLQLNDRLTITGRDDEATELLKAGRIRIAEVAK